MRNTIHYHHYDDRAPQGNLVFTAQIARFLYWTLLHCYPILSLPKDNHRVYPPRRPFYDFPYPWAVRFDLSPANLKRNPNSPKEEICNLSYSFIYLLQNRGVSLPFILRCHGHQLQGGNKTNGRLMASAKVCRRGRDPLLRLFLTIHSI